ncbi:hypothetical protein B566_EDAN006145 [Ephemera danica]|nr:hypothetical protein B566_EDAN006145 [Ephemera danica]
MKCLYRPAAETRPPSKNREPVTIEFSIYIVDINSINVEDMDFRVTLYRNKTIRYAARMHAIVACQMEFQLYPMDIQVCPMAIESFSYTNQKLRLVWAQDGVTVNPDLKLLQYNVGQPLQLEESSGFMLEKEGNYSRLVAYFRFERQIGHHLIQTFAPSALVVMLSWFSFWLGLDAIPGRVTLLVTSMLTLVTMFTGLKSDIPPVAYVKALDLWMAGCMVFVFAALGEFVVVKVLDVQYQEHQVCSQRHVTSSSSLHNATNNNNNGNATTPRFRILPPQKSLHALTRNCIQGRTERVQPTRAEKVSVKSAWDVEAGVRSRKLVESKPESPMSSLKRRLSWALPPLSWLDTATGEERVLWREIDRLSRLIFPGFFLLFVLAYWPLLLLKSSSQGGGKTGVM